MEKPWTLLSSHIIRLVQTCTISSSGQSRNMVPGVGGFILPSTLQSLQAPEASPEFTISGEKWLDRRNLHAVATCHEQPQTGLILFPKCKKCLRPYTPFFNAFCITPTKNVMGGRHEISWYFCAYTQQPWSLLKPGKALKTCSQFPLSRIYECSFLIL